MQFHRSSHLRSRAPSVINCNDTHGKNPPALAKSLRTQSRRNPGMASADRQKQFQDAVEKVVGKIDETKEAYGFSNAARLIEGGFLVPFLNLDSVTTTATSFAAFTKVFVSADVEIHVA